MNLAEREIFRIEECSLNAWPALRSVLYGGWVLRWAAGYTKRANSVSALGAARAPLDETVDYCEQFYADRGLPAVFKLTAAASHRELDGLLDTRGYACVGRTVVMLRSLDGLPAADGAGVECEDGFDTTWIDAFCGLDVQKAPHRETIAAMLGRIDGPVAAARLIEENETVACGYAAVEDGRAGIFDILVRPDRRRRGIGRRLVTTLLCEARELGAREAYLQVEEDNLSARGLYASLGFRDAYRYWYRRAERSR